MLVPSSLEEKVHVLHELAEDRRLILLSLRCCQRQGCRVREGRRYRQ